MTRAEREKLVYRSLRNQGYSPQEARKYRSYTPDRIIIETGVKLPKKVPELKELTPAQIKRKQQERKRFEYAKSIGGFTVEQQIKARKQGMKSIATKKTRTSQWGRWIKEDKLPRQYVNQAHALNLKNGFDKNASYGFQVVWYAYIEDVPVAEMEKSLKKDYFTQQILYMISSKKAKRT